MVISPKIRVAASVFVELVFAAFGAAFQSEVHPVIGALVGAGLGAVFLAVIWFVYVGPYEETHTYNEVLVKQIDEAQALQRAATKERDSLKALIYDASVYVDQVYADFGNDNPIIIAVVTNDGDHRLVNVRISMFLYYEAHDARWSESLSIPAKSKVNFLRQCPWSISQEDLDAGRKQIDVKVVVYHNGEREYPFRYAPFPSGNRPSGLLMFERTDTGRSGHINVRIGFAEEHDSAGALNWTGGAPTQPESDGEILGMVDEADIERSKGSEPSDITASTPDTEAPPDPSSEKERPGI